MKYIIGKFLYKIFSMGSKGGQNGDWGFLGWYDFNLI